MPATCYWKKKWPFMKCVMTAALIIFPTSTVILKR